MIRLFWVLQLTIAVSPWLIDAWKYQKQDMNEILAKDEGGPYLMIIPQYEEPNSLTDSAPLYVGDAKTEEVQNNYRIHKYDKIVREILRDLQKQPGFEDLRMKFLKNRVALDAEMEQRLLEKVTKRAMKRISKKLKYTRRRKSLGIAGFGRRSWNTLNGGSDVVGGSSNPCPEGQTRVRGVCSCPYLRTWNTENSRCECIYGTYQDEHGNCRSFF